MDLLACIAVALIAFAAVAAKFGGLGIVAAAFTTLRDSRLAQGAALALIGILTLFMVRRDGRKEGRAEAKREVEAANRRAVEKRKRVDDQVGRRTDSQVREELKRWSR